MTLGDRTFQLPPRQVLTTAHGVEISYFEWNPGGIPLILLHGMADHAGVWASLGASLGADLGDRYHILAPDLRGHGESSKPATGYSFTDTIQDVKALMAHYGWTSAHLLGHSWTAKLLVVWATREPEQFRSMILVDPAFMNRFPRWSKLTFPLFYKILPFLKMLGPFPDKAAAATQARQLKQYRDWTPLQQQVFEQSVEQKPDGSWGSKFAIAAREPMFDAIMEPGFTQTLDLPTLLVRPTLGINRSEKQLQPYRQFLPQLEICTLESNHWAFLVDPERFDGAIAQFLEQQS